MLKKRLGIEAIERDWSFWKKASVGYFKIPSTLIISENCERVGEGTFSGCGTLLKKVIIPKSVKVIKSRAFWGCTNTKIFIETPKEKSKEDTYAFNGCKNVEYAEKETRS